VDIRLIRSNQNEQYKRWRKLHRRKGRERYGALLVEGPHLVAEAMDAGWKVRACLVEEGKEGLLEEIPGIREGSFPVYRLPVPLFRSLMDTETPQGVAAELEIPPLGDEEAPPVGETLILLDAVQDPGNLGTILRTAEAAGAAAVFLGKGTADPYNSKTVRAAMGSLFRLPVRRVELASAILDLRRRGVVVIGTHPRAETLHFCYEYPPRTAFLLGNEGRGVDPDLERLVDAQVRVPMPGGVESLNVSVTAAVLLYERLRQKWGKA
jgi:RNA methyltransferase, TrmH family